MTPDEYYRDATKRNIGIVSRAEQDVLRGARVGIVGMGGAGGIYLTTLVRMGIGRFHISDFDTFSVVNINRQAGAMSSTIGRPKAEVMAEIARDIHPGVEVVSFDRGVGEHNIDDFLRGVDVVLDGADNFPVRYLLNDACVKLRIPLVYGAVQRFQGQASVFDAGRQRVVLLTGLRHLIGIVGKHLFERPHAAFEVIHVIQQGRRQQPLRPARARRHHA